MGREGLKGAVETLLFVSDAPVRVGELVDVFAGMVGAEAVEGVLADLMAEYEGRPLQVQKVAEGYRLATRPEYALWIRRYLKRASHAMLSASALETLAVVAYRQPVTRAELEEIRGVDCTAVLRTLLDKRLVRIVGRRQVLGRPMVYGTTRTFLEHFGLPSLTDLPKLKELVPP